ncbi:hypothetical protein IE077_001562, partial [Cardiosporidium cionae]
DFDGLPDVPLNITRPNLFTAVKDSSIQSLEATVIAENANYSTNSRNTMRLRVSSGHFKGRKLESPISFLRPMMGKVKEAIFSTLNCFQVFTENSTRVLDLYSGSGAVGIEALSRGANAATFVDISKECCLTIKRNLARCHSTEKGRVLRAAVEEVLQHPDHFSIYGQFDIIFVCPPYEDVRY